MRLAKLVAVAAAGLGFVATVPAAQAAELLGCRSVGFINDRDTIPVGRSEGRFRAIKVTVKGNAIDMRDLDVVYGNGANDDLQVRASIPAGGETRWIDLRGGGRLIRQINMTYASKPNFRGQAEVCVYGR